MMIFEKSRDQYAFGITWFVMLIVAFLIFNYGVNDKFYFDDYSNISQLGNHGGVTDWESLKQYLFSNPAGPTGRPISVLSFLLNDFSWPSTASSFKTTNILIHLIIACLVFWAATLFLNYAKKEKGIIVPAWAPIFVAGVWLLNPLHISTVLYPVQRMAQLSTLFCMVGIVAYLKFRPNITEKNKTGAIPLIVLVLTSLFLAVFSKENGGLLLLYVFVIEIFLFRDSQPLPRGLRILSRLVFGLSVFGILGIVFYKASVNGWFDPYPGRDFSPYERLITQPKVLLLYLKEFYIPSLYTPGLYYDDFKHSESLWRFGTLVPMLAFSLLFVFAIVLFSKRSLAGFALIFFLVGHSLESTALNLELVFEHRNYQPSVFLGFVYVWIFGFLKRPTLSRILPLSILILYSSFTLSRADLWRDDLLFGAVLAEQSPNSVRSQIEYNNALLARGRLDDAIEHMEKTVKNNPNEIYLSLHSVLLDCLGDVNRTESYDRLLSLAETQAFDARNFLALDKLWLYMLEKRCDNLNPDYFSKLLSAFYRGEKVGRRESEVSRRGLRVLSERFYLRFPSFATGRIATLKNVIDSNNPEYLMLSAATLASSGRYREAIFLAQRAQSMVQEGNLGTSDWSKERFESEIRSFIEAVKESAE